MEHRVVVKAPVFYSLVTFMASSKFATDDFKKHELIASIGTGSIDVFSLSADDLVAAFKAVVNEFHQVPKLCDRIQFLGNLTQMGQAFMSGLRGDASGYRENRHIIDMQDLSRTCNSWPQDNVAVQISEDGGVAVFSCS